MGLKYKDNGGNVGEPQTLTDLSQNTIAVDKLRRDIKWLWILTLVLIFLFLIYIAKYNILTNSLRMLSGY